MIVYASIQAPSAGLRPRKRLPKRLRRGYAPASGSPRSLRLREGQAPPRKRPPTPRPPAQAQGTLHTAGTSEQALRSPPDRYRALCPWCPALALGGRHAVPAGAPAPRIRGAPRHAVPAGLPPPPGGGAPVMPSAGLSPPALAGAPWCTWRRTINTRRATVVAPDYLIGIRQCAVSAPGRMG